MHTPTLRVIRPHLGDDLGPRRGRVFCLRRRPSELNVDRAVGDPLQRQGDILDDALLVNHPLSGYGTTEKHRENERQRRNPAACREYYASLPRRTTTRTSPCVPGERTRGPARRHAAGVRFEFVGSFRRRPAASRRAGQFMAPVLERWPSRMLQNGRSGTAGSGECTTNRAEDAPRGHVDFPR